MYLKITNAAENHRGLQYNDGLNIDPVPFAREGTCVPGGIYFTTPEYICNFIGMGVWVREVTVPEDAEIVQDPQGDKWRASKVILGPKKHLREVETWKRLFEIITDMGNEVYSKALNAALRWSSYWGYLEVVKYLVENGANIHTCDNYSLNWSSLRWASEMGHLEIVKFLLKNGSDIHACDDYALRFASQNGHLEVVKYLEEYKRNI